MAETVARAEHLFRLRYRQELAGTLAMVVTAARVFMAQAVILLRLDLIQQL
ncbi:hypothetical protein OHAE_2423 [Ochrobactrum soli]|uniref:Uncharacterized protein n=1 Tax=Ochrobactrum soli TaxID=2448455 RepID=A0A2P9HR11_9HYPH|nr:hypothetical protein OHAE_2423 [[Ochrobactrum] soli]